jgi:N utilization substance protein A
MLRQENLNPEFIEALKQLERDKGIKVESIVEALSNALLSAYKKKYGALVDSRVEIDTVTGDIKVFETVTREGNRQEDIEVTPKDFGRIAAQTAKQVIKQRILEFERDNIYEEYKNRIGDLVTGIIQQSHERMTLIDLGGKIEALLPMNEQVYGERYEHGRRIKCYIIDVRKSTKGPSIIVSRTHPGLVKRLFELEVPEIYDGIVEIKAIAREPGQRTKIAVHSMDTNVDPVGACVGQKGSRVRMVVAELNGEKIDILNFSKDPAEFVKNALRPAKTKSVEINDEEHTALVVVPDDQQSLAIGKDGQNARLAAKLTGWRIDIVSESEAGQVTTVVIEGEEQRADEIRKEKVSTSNDGICMAINKNGIRCKNRVLPGSAYCGIPAHQRQESPSDT